MLNDCISCKFFDYWQGLWTAYATQALTQLSAYAPGFEAAILLLYGTIECGKYIARQDLIWGDIARNLILIMFASSMISSANLWFDWIINPFLDFSSGVAISLASVGGAAPSRTGITGLLEMIETPAFTLITGSRTLEHAGGFWDGLSYFLLTIFLVGLFAYIWIQMVLSLIWAQTKIMVTAALGVLYLLALLVPFTRKIATNSIKVLTVASLEIILTGMMAGIMGACANYARNYLPVDTNGAITKDGQDFLLSNNYLFLVLVGFALILVESKLKAYAATIGDAMDASASRFSPMQAANTMMNAARLVGAALKKSGKLP